MTEVPTCMDYVCRSSRMEHVLCRGSIASLDQAAVRPSTQTAIISDHQREPQTSMSRETRKRKAKLNPEHGDIHGHSSAPSRYHKSHVYSAAVRRGENLNTLVLKIHTAEGLFLFHSALTSSVQLDCFAFSTQPRSSERVHVLKCREM